MAIREDGLVVVLAAATPMGIFLYSVAFSDLFMFSRNLLASLPFAALAFGWLLLRLPPLAARPALALAGVGLAIGTAGTIGTRPVPAQTTRSSRTT